MREQQLQGASVLYACEGVLHYVAHKHRLWGRCCTVKQRGRKTRHVIRNFHVVWTRLPSDEVVIEAGARALRLYVERQAAQAKKAEGEE